MRSNSTAIIAALFIAEVAVVFESSMLYTALPTLIRQFGDPIAAGWLITVHMLIGAAVSVVIGRLGDIYGRKPMMLAVLAIAAAGSVLSAVTTHFGLVLVGRAMQGFAVAAIPLTIGVVRESLPAARVPVAVGLMTTATATGGAVGLVLGGVIVDRFNWHWLFVLSAILLAISWLAIRLILPERPGTRPGEPVNWIEGALLVPGIMALLYGFSLSKKLGWSSPVLLGWIALGVVVLAWWARISLRAKEPFVDLRLLGTRNVAIANGLAAFLSLGTMQVMLIFALYIQSPSWTMVGLGLTATAAGLSKLPSNVVSLVSGPLAGYLSARTGTRPIVVTGMLLTATGWFASMGLPDSLGAVIVLLCVITFGSSMLNAAIYLVLVEAVPQQRTGEAIGMTSVFRGISTAIGAQVVSILLASDTVIAPGGARLTSAAGYHMAMAWIGGVSLLGAVLALLLRPVAKPLPPAVATSPAE
jgi:MFS family permease